MYAHVSKDGKEVIVLTDRVRLVHLGQFLLPVPLQMIYRKKALSCQHPGDTLPWTAMELMISGLLTRNFFQRFLHFVPTRSVPLVETVTMRRGSATASPALKEEDVAARPVRTIAVVMGSVFSAAKSMIECTRV